MKKSIFLAIALTIMMVFGFTASSYACWGMNCTEASATAGVSGVGGDQFGPNQGYGYYEGGASSASDMCGFFGKSAATADANGFGTGDGFSFMGNGNSYGFGTVESEGAAGSLGLGYGDSTASVGGGAGQYNQTNVNGWNGNAGARNETWASYEGTDHSSGLILDAAAVEGGATGIGGSNAYTYSTGNHTVAGASTLGASNAYQTGCGETNASGYGEVFHNTQAQSNFFGNTASAGTSGYAAGSYNNNGGNVAAGMVGATTNGESHTYTGPNFSAANASSSSTSFSK